jgi:hypothetical protein
MDDLDRGVIHHAGAGGVIGKHPDPAPLRVLAGPATGSELDTVRIPLIVINCWRIEDIRFAFDSSFVTYSPEPSSDPTSDPVAKPFSDQDDIRKELNAIADLVHDNQECPLSVFGHADPSYEGNFELGSATQDPGDEYNKALSGRRATTIYALLISGTQQKTAADLWQKVASQENWGANQRQVMQQATALPDGTPMDSLIINYLQRLCPPELKLSKKDFLAQGDGPGGKGDYQGCSRFNPLVLFSDDDEQRFKTAFQQKDQEVLQERNTKNAPNRRVMVLMFKKGTKVDPAKWPCPSATADKSGCIRRFWSNGQTRRSRRLSDGERRFEDTYDTFACRFYDRLLTASPCERVLIPCPWCALMSHVPPSNQTVLGD